MRSYRWIVGASPVVGALILAAGCAFRNGVLVGDDAGSLGTKSYGPKGQDDRFTWSEDSVNDGALVWDRQATPALSHSDAISFCDRRGMRLPTRAELLDVSDFLGTDLFPSARGDWHWSSTQGSREHTAWAVGFSGYANANDVDAKSLVRCVKRSR